MRTRILPTILLVLASYTTTVYSAESAEPHQFLSPPEIAELIKKSDTCYQISCSMEELENVNPANTIESLFPLSVRPIGYPWRTAATGGPNQVAEYAFSDELSKMFGEAESSFNQGQFYDAIASYRRIIDRFPDCYIAYAHLGDCYYRLQQYEKAVDLLDQAIERNPFDHRAFLYKADSLAHLGQLTKAKATYIHALSLRPHYWLAVANLQHQADILNIEVRTDLFQPRIYVRREGDKIGVYFGDESCVKLWLSYALVKAAWLGEPSHRKFHTGDSAYAWSSMEETEALLNLTAIYESLRQDDETPPDPKLDLLVKIIDAGDLPQFIIYEIASRMCPHITLTLSKDARESLREFIGKYIVVPAAKEQNAAAVNPMIATNIERKH